MLFVKYMLLVMGVGMFLVAAATIANDLWMARQFRRRSAVGLVAIEPEPVRWRATAALTCLAWAPMLIALSIAVRPHDQAHAIANPQLYASARK